MRTLTAALAFLILSGCNGASPPVLSSLDSMGVATMHVLEWADAHGLEPAVIIEATKAIAEKDYKTAVPLLSRVVDKSIAAGDVPSQDVQAFLLLAQEIVAVEGLQDGLRAVSQ